MFSLGDLFGDIFNSDHSAEQQQDDYIMKELRRQRYLQQQVQGQRAMSQKEINAYNAMRQTQKLPNIKAEN